MKGFLDGFWSIVKKEWLHLRRDPATLIFALAIPVVQLILFGFAIDFDVRHIPTVVVDMDKTRESRSYVDSLRNTQYLDVVAYSDSPDKVEQILRQGNVHVGVIIPPDFSRRSVSGDTPTVRVLIDGSDSQVATPARNAFMRASDTSGVRQETSLVESNRPAAVEPRINMLFNPEMRSQVYIIPGLIGVILQLVTVALTSFSLVREREQGTLEQLMVSPLGAVALMLGKLAPYSVLAMCEMGAVLVLESLIFDVQVTGSVILLLLLGIPFVLATLSLGLLISTIAQNQGQALQMTILITLPSILLSGFMFPRDTMPGPLYLLSHIIPVTYFMQILRGIVVRGAGLSDLIPSLLGLLIITTVLLGLAMARFRKSAA